jgi:REP element-mobilizing transposase RayT
MKQLSLIKKSLNSKLRLEHGGHITLGRRRRRRPLDIKQPHHLVLKSDFAYGQRMLTRHRPLIKRILQKAKKRFDIKVYEFAIVSNHIHVLAKGSTRSDLQNFFRVVAGHTAQEILRQHPILAKEQSRVGGSTRSGASSALADQGPGGASATGRTPTSAPHKTRERENKFWQTRLYSRVVSWGREFMSVKKYVIQNVFESLGVIAYKPRHRHRKQKIERLNTNNTS